MLRAILLLQLVAMPPPAPSTAEAARLVHDSINDFELGAFEKALHEAEEAYRLAPLPQILFNIGQCHKALKHWEKAAYYYQRYLAKVPSAPNRAAVEDFITEVTYRLKAEQLPVAPPPPAPAPPSAEISPPPAPPAPAAPIPVLVVSSAPLSTTTPEAVPPAAVEVAPEPHHSHTAAWILGSVAVACVAVAVVSIVEVESFESLQGRLANPVSYSQWEKDDATALTQGPQASNWEVTAIVTGATAIATGTAAGLVW